MAGGLLALLDDVALIARSAASSIDDVAALAGKTSLKAAGVVIDDAAVTPGYIEGIKPARELPMIWRIAKGSLINKLIIILPIILLLSWLAPWALTPLLMLGGTYLAFEGAHKIVSAITGHDEKEKPAQDRGPGAEDRLVRGAVTTDLILSAEIMVISMNALLEETFWMRAGTLIVVGLLITAVVYGAVALLVKMDDIGLHLVSEDKAVGFGRGLVKAMPIVLNIIGIVGTFAMLWVGGHIMIVGAEELFWAWPAEFSHGMVDAVGGGFLGWLVETLLSLVVGLIWGLIVTAVVEPIRIALSKRKEPAPASA